MKNSKHKIAAILALFIGALTVIAGSRVLLGFNTPDYHVLQWLVIYNIVAGVVAIAVSVIIWKKHSFMKPTSLSVLTVHVLILILLAAAFSEVVAFESLKAMIFRIVIWSAIVILPFKNSKR